jgi:hypothetical protein
MRKGIKHEKASPFFDKLVFSKVEIDYPTITFKEM